METPLQTSDAIFMKDVHKVYKTGDIKVEALRGLTLSIKKGEFASIMGQSGSGKSTCMNMIGLLDRPTSGVLLINGKSIEGLTDREAARLRSRTIGFVFQQYHLISNMTVLENVILPLRYQNVPRRERVLRGKEILDQMGLIDRLRHLPSELSGGQKQRVAIARALITRPLIILADEPTGALDSFTGRTVMEILRKINKGGTTVVIVTHDVAIGESCPRCIKIVDGQVVS